MGKFILCPRGGFCAGSEDLTRLAMRLRDIVRLLPLARFPKVLRPLGGTCPDCPDAASHVSGKGGSSLQVIGREPLALRVD